VIRKYINGESYPTLDRLETIAATADVSFTWLATGEGFPVEGVRINETQARIEGLARSISLHVVALNVGLVSANPEFAAHQREVVPHLLSDVPFGEFIGEMLSEIDARGLWDAGNQRDKFLHDQVQDKLTTLYHEAVNGYPPPWPRWMFALMGTGAAG